MAGALRGDPDPEGAGKPDRLSRVGGRLGLHDDGRPLVRGQVPRQVILQSLADDAIQAWIGRQLPRLLRRAGLTDLSVTPAMVLAVQQMIRCS